MAVYPMSSFLIPKQVCRDIDSKLRKFWWGTPINKSKSLCLKAWEQICQPKSSGGLGCKLMEKQNLALLARLCWKMVIGGKNLWIKYFHEKYIENSCLNFLVCEAKASDSCMWKGLLKCRDLLKDGICWQVGSGVNINLWLNPWIPNMDRFMPIFNPLCSNFEGVNTVAGLIDQEPRRWNEHRLGKFFSASTCVEIFKIPLSQTSTDDKIIWTKTKNGSFTSKSVYLSLLQPYDRGIGKLNEVEWKSLWKLQITDRLKLLMWKLATGCFKTKDILQKFIQLSVAEQTCVLCHEKLESITHLLFECAIVRALWRSSPWPLHIDRLAAMDVADWIRIILKPSILLGAQSSEVDRHGFQIFAIIIIDVLWMYRNNLIFKACNFNFLDLKQSLFSTFEDHRQAWNLKKSCVENRSEWIPPEDNCIKINVDVAVRSSGSMLAMIARNNDGHVCNIVTQFSKTNDSLIAEALAVELGVCEAAKAGYSNVIVESDSQIVVTAANDPHLSANWSINNIIASIRHTFLSMRACRVQYAHRSANFLAHNLAQWAATNFKVGSLPVNEVFEDKAWMDGSYKPP